jgi:hypothetical protein
VGGLKQEIEETVFRIKYGATGSGNAQMEAKLHLIRCLVDLSALNAIPCFHHFAAIFERSRSNARNLDHK